MLAKRVFSYLALFCIVTGPLKGEINQSDQFVQLVGPLVYHINELQSDLEEPLQDTIDFSEEEVRSLWEQAAHLLYQKGSRLQKGHYESAFNEAYELYYQARNLLNNQDLSEGQSLLKRAHSKLFNVWEKVSDAAFPLSSRQSPLDSFLNRETSVSILDKNSAIPDFIKKKMKPYVIENSHPLKKQLDAIFTNVRATTNESTFEQAGFITLCKRPRSFICVASHPWLPDHLVKVNFDSELRQKRGKPSWEWLVLRCEGAEKVKKIIDYKNYKFFTVAKKWIYPLPENPAPPSSPFFTRHLAVLLVTDMNLTSSRENKKAWINVITKEHLKELYTIISYAKGSSYRPDNIWYTKTGQFAFIDTEYPSQGPDYRSIAYSLSPEMRSYWERLVKRGGK